MGVIEICIKYLKLIELQCYVLFLSAFDVEINAKNERKGVSRMWENAYMNTRMQSSRMHTICYSSCLWGRGVSGWGGVCPGGGCIPACTEADIPPVDRILDKQL